jgi:hypothetical protein
MPRAALRAVLVTLLVLSTGCGGSTTPTSPFVPVEPVPAPLPNFPPLSGPSRIFTFSRGLDEPVQQYTKQSRFVLYDNGAFVLQYLNNPICNCDGTYRGVYKDANGAITFEWEGWSVAGPWGATATLEGDSLTVRYNVIMMLSDFEDAVYLRT